MFKNHNFEQDYYSRLAIGICKLGHNSIRLMKLLAYYDRSHYVIINFCDLMGSVLKYLNEIS